MKCLKSTEKAFKQGSDMLGHTFQKNKPVTLVKDGLEGGEARDRRTLRALLQLSLRETMAATQGQCRADGGGVQVKGCSRGRINR